MKNFQKISVILLGVFIVPLMIGCGGQTVNDAAVSDVTWLKGQWKGQAGDSTMSEKWTQMNEDLIRGVGFVVEEGDTVGVREMTITRADTRLVLNLRVSRDQQPIGYQLVKIDGRKLVFENEEAGNPMKITYDRQNGLMKVQWEGGEGAKAYKLEKKEAVE